MRHFNLIAELRSARTRSHATDEHDRTFDAVSLGIMWDRLVSLTDEIVSTLVRSSFSTIVYESYDLSVRRARCRDQLDRAGHVRHSGLHRQRAGDAAAHAEEVSGRDAEARRHRRHQRSLARHRPPVRHHHDAPGLPQGPHRRLHGQHHASARYRRQRLRLVGDRDLPGRPAHCRSASSTRPASSTTCSSRSSAPTCACPSRSWATSWPTSSCNEVGGREILALHGRVRPRRSDARCRAPSAASPRRPCAPRSPSSATAPTATASRSKASRDRSSSPCASTSRATASTIDFDGTSGCVRAGVNVPFCYTNAMGLHAIKSLTLPSIPNNEGSVAPIKVHGAGGLHPQCAAALPDRRAPRHGPLRDAADLRRAGRSRARARAGRLRHDEPHHLPGPPPRRPRRSRASISRRAATARSTDLDGWATLPHPSNMAVVPVEIWETLTHMTVESKRLLTDSGGAGRWRGGLGQEVVLRNDTGHPLTMLGMGNRTEFPARACSAVRPARLRVHAVDGKPVHAKGRIEVAPGAAHHGDRSGRRRLRRSQGTRAGRRGGGRGGGLRQPGGGAADLRVAGLRRAAAFDSGVPGRAQGSGAVHTDHPWPALARDDRFSLAQR